MLGLQVKKVCEGVRTRGYSTVKILKDRKHGVGRRWMKVKRVGTGVMDSAQKPGGKPMVALNRWKEGNVLDGKIRKRL